MSMGKEVRVMSNRGGGDRRGGNGEEEGMVTERKKNKNIYRPTHWASGWEKKELQPCVGMRREETLFCYSSCCCCYVQTCKCKKKIKNYASFISLNHINEKESERKGEVNDLRDVSGGSGIPAEAWWSVNNA